MTREELQRLSVAELVELVLHWQASVQQLQARITELEAQVGRPKKTPSNSSVPPAQPYKANRSEPVEGGPKRGPKEGHRGATRAAAEPDVKIAAKVERCDRCGHELGAAEHRPVERRQVVEIPPMQPIIIEAEIYQVQCPACGQRHTATFPAAFTAPQAFGPRIQTLATYLHQVHHVPYGRLETMMGEVFGLEIAAGSLVNWVRRTGVALEGQAEAIRLEVIHSAVIGSDETSARVEGCNQWQWVFRTPQASYYVIVPSGGAQVIRDVLGQARPEVWLSDLWSAQQKAPAEPFQLCHSHQLRDLEYARQCGDTVFAPAMQELLRRSEALAKEREDLEAEEFERRKQAIYTECAHLLAEDTAHAEGSRLQKRYRQHQGKLFVFLERPDVPFDNNGSERDLRNSVVHRKVTGGFRSDWAPKTFATITTVVETAKKRGEGVFQTLLRGIGRSLPLELSWSRAQQFPVRLERAEKRLRGGESFCA
jgi:transposase